MHKKTISLIIIAVVAVFVYINIFGGKQISVSNVPEPKQTEAEGGTSFELNGYKVYIAFLNTYEMKALAVSSHHYYGFGLDNALSPVDLAVCWGSVAKNNGKINFHWHQGGRWVSWRLNSYDELAPIGSESDVNRQSANCHLIPANDSVKKVVMKMKAGDYVKIKGYLADIYGVNAAGNEFFWTSSTSRNDTGAHACEVIYVTDAEILN